MTKDYAEWVTPGDVKEESDIQVGEGAVLRAGGKKIAVYKNEKGEVHRLSAACGHMGCIVAWNTGEKSWDCPCHGSRFTVEGRIIDAPTLKELAKVDDKNE